MKKKKKKPPSKFPVQLSAEPLQWSSWRFSKERVTDFIRPDFACLSGDSTQCLLSFKPPPVLLLRLLLPPQHPSAGTCWTSHELFAASASWSFWLSHEYSLFFIYSVMTYCILFESEHMGVLTALLVLKQLRCATPHKQRQRLNLTAVISAAQCAHDLITKAEGVGKQTGVFFSLYYPVMVC